MRLLARAILVLGFLFPFSGALQAADLPAFLLTVGITYGNGGHAVVSDNTGSLDCTNLANACSWGYKQGTVVTLTATLESGTTFLGWGGACSGTATTCTVTINADTHVTAAFETHAQQYILQLNTSKTNQGSGTITSSPAGIVCNGCTGATPFDSGTTVTLTATPAAGSTFTGWSGACSGTGTCTVTMNANQTVTAAFQGSGGGDKVVLNLGVTATGGASGTITSSPAGLTCNVGCNGGAAAFASGTAVSLTATPAAGSTFVGWSGACTGSGVCTVTMSSNQSVAASFALADGSSGGSSGGAFPNVVAPLFTSNGNSSFIRLGNGGSAQTTFKLTVLGAPSGALYGSTQYQVPANASPQYALSSILAAAGAGALANGDTSYRLAIQDADPALSYQHVIYNSGNFFFENVSACHFDAARDYSALNATLYNVHTSLLAAYPAQIYADNYAEWAATYNVSVYDNNTGNIIGIVPITIPAKSTFSQPFSWFEQQLKWTPSSSQAHANLVFSAVNPPVFAITVSNYIFNQQLSAYVNMTQRCGLSH